ncbi:MAG TPA: hypothetical protein EYQ00_09095 [Dehalococcoidia bacterium]|jgi:hypothetical protein|nr:hypothetical protein [Dehalococcoidia bacterium]
MRFNIKIDPLVQHFLIFVALIFNLWVGGLLLEIYVGSVLKLIFESLLIFGYLAFVIRLWPFTKNSSEDSEDEL